MEEAAAVIRSDLEEEGVPVVLAHGVPAPEVVVAVRAGADGLQAALQQRPVRWDARPQFHLKYHEAPSPVC
jgi:hypothetical protein